MTATMRKYIRLQIVDSSHKFAVRLIDGGKAEECVIIAKNQTDGVGRRGRLWESYEGNLFASIIKKIPQDENFGRVSLAVARAVHKAIARYVPDELYLHWPNDIYYKKSKIAGILIATANSWSVISVGADVNAAPNMPRAACLKDICGVDNISTEEVLENILIELDKCFEDLSLFGFSSIKNYWLRYINETDCKVTIRNGLDSLTGIFRGIDDSGRLILEKDGRNLFISTGDMFLNMEGIKASYE
jgi:BirA family biotin operon repressor/biotin-[acetyl-CoA-carboxylase] ligase